MFIENTIEVKVTPIGMNKEGQVHFNDGSHSGYDKQGYKNKLYFGVMLRGGLARRHQCRREGVVDATLRKSFAFHCNDLDLDSPVVLLWKPIDSFTKEHVRLLSSNVENYQLIVSQFGNLVLGRLKTLRHLPILFPQDNIEQARRVGFTDLSPKMIFNERPVFHVLHNWIRIIV